jgi:predicted Zn-dependent protease with MMP-like domain
LSEEEFVRLVREALADIPPSLAPYLENVVVDVEDLPDAETCESVGVEDREELLGLYHGTPLTEQGLETDVRLPDRVVLYRRNIESLCCNRREIVEEIRTTVFHEVGHHFGLDEDDLAELGFD